MKKLINDPAVVIAESLVGLTRTAAGVARLGGSAPGIRADVGELRQAGLVAVGGRPLARRGGLDAPPTTKKRRS
ncbi:hypothetical protein AB0J83_49260 [Actinoplanes sp. NPDC049596]|uniref:hypothetical protein n=1 Tax=unclassified Actinoplanes TaxID=2626549 RepID=UPI0034338362